MSRNRRKHANTVRIAAVVLWVVVFTFLGVIGLSYVYIKNQTIAFGDQRRKSERELNDLVSQNRALASQITALTSRAALQRQLASGFIQMVEIDPVKIVRLNGSQSAVARLQDGDGEALLTQVVAQK